ncbi:MULTISPECIES: hypothetical protein [unclassified Empedobacter]|uniref:hypothetical protein n=1 Tax=unclassified Empedobacter TaxID=2643773 RepID=UPI0025B8C2C5|nr:MULTISPECIES: hypothetical protein [unclassified Empedobacter]
MTGIAKTPDFFTHIYKVNHEVKTYSVYELDKSRTDKSLLTDILRVETYNGKSEAKGIDKYLRLRTSSNWTTSEKVTGLRPTSIKNVFYGNRIVNDKRNLLIFVFSDDYKWLKIDVYRSFYPKTPKILTSIITTNYKTKKRGTNEAPRLFNKNTAGIANILNKGNDND